ncbi:ubiquinone anaerobic biosynthesis protein UbiV [Arenibaculum pallidiluteum]|uniref:ubiquinone anaerobic biosynthesis protein UbiV n=1 Tax=Arenibaculum pallidiluteum TaxID=2812559 RepID=UPI001A962127|nr:U32 family peptidase [Arenibaculum pallidiluteum]
MTGIPARLTLGPVLFNWPAARLADFYRRITDEAPVDTVVLGEVVCAKRPPAVEVLAESVDRLRRAGKEVLLATLALVMQPRERQAVRDLAVQDDAPVEANDATALALLRGRPHAVGPYVQVYNEETLALFASHGATRLCLGPDLPVEAVVALAARAAELPGFSLEVLAFGRLPLAISARCYHARAHGLQKDGCQFVCGRDPDGLEVETLDDAPFLAVNGVQVLSGSYGCLLPDLQLLQAAGITGFRLSPQAVDMVAVADIHRSVLDGELAAAEGQVRLAALMPEARFANGFLHARAGLDWLAARRTGPE